jgi:UDP-N-acetylmuramate--alanine ligase
LRQEFARCFGDADRVLVTEIYAAREAPLPGVSGASLADGIAEQMTGRPVEFVGDLAALPDRLAAESRPGDLVMTMGAGDINTLGPKLVAALKEKRAGRAR